MRSHNARRVENLEQSIALVLVNRIVQSHLDVVPKPLAQRVEHVHHDGVEHSEGYCLQSHADGLFSHADVRVPAQPARVLSTT
jgi:hypothetical protein